MRMRMTRRGSCITKCKGAQGCRICSKKLGGESSRFAASVDFSISDTSHSGLRTTRTDLAVSPLGKIFRRVWSTDDRTGLIFFYRQGEWCCIGDTPPNEKACVQDQFCAVCFFHRSVDGGLKAAYRAPYSVVLYDVVVDLILRNKTSLRILCIWYGKLWIFITSRKKTL